MRRYHREPIVLSGMGGVDPLPETDPELQPFLAWREFLTTLDRLNKIKRAVEILKAEGESDLARKMLALPYYDAAATERYLSYSPSDRAAINGWMDTLGDLREVAVMAWKEEFPQEAAALVGRAIDKCEEMHGAGQCGATWEVAEDRDDERETSWLGLVVSAAVALTAAWWFTTTLRRT